MEYKYAEIGKRIREMRKRKHMTQNDLLSELSEKVKIGRNSLSNIENGDVGKCDIDFLKALCEIFKCDIGYLLGEYECTTKEATDIHAVTGLSEDAIGTLRSICKKNYAGNIIGQAKTTLLNNMLEDDDFLDDVANALYGIFSIPTKCIGYISFLKENGEPDGTRLMSDDSKSLAGLFAARLQNEIFSFIERTYLQSSLWEE